MIVKCVNEDFSNEFALRELRSCTILQQLLNVKCCMTEVQQEVQQK